MDQLDAFIHDIIAAKQLPGITDEAKQGLVEEMRERLIDTINRALIDALPEDKVQAFSALLDTDDIDDAKVQAFIAESGVDVEQVTAQALLAFRGLYLQSSEEAPKE